MISEKDKDSDLDLDLDEEAPEKPAAGAKGGSKKKLGQVEEKAKPQGQKGKKDDGKPVSKIAPYKTDLPPGIYKATHHILASEKGPAVPGKPGFYVNQHGIAFPVGFKFRGGHVSSKGNVVLVRCPECGNKLGVSEAVKGLCDNRDCNYSAVDTLDEITEDDI